jgi:hypothetical protein
MLLAALQIMSPPGRSMPGRPAIPTGQTGDDAVKCHPFISNQQDLPFHD